MLFFYGLTFLVLMGIGLLLWDSQPRRSRALLLSLPIVTTLGSCGLCSIPSWVNDFQLAQFAARFFNYPLPPETTVLERRTTVGLMGNGNHCDFVAEQWVHSALSLDELKAYYAEVTFPPARHEHPPVSVRVTQEEPRPTGDTRYRMQLADFDYDPGFDWRCH